MSHSQLTAALKVQGSICPSVPAGMACHCCWRIDMPPRKPWLLHEGADAMGGGGSRAQTLFLILDDIQQITSRGQPDAFPKGHPEKQQRCLSMQPTLGPSGGVPTFNAPFSEGPRVGFLPTPPPRAVFSLPPPLCRLCHLLGFTSLLLSSTPTWPGGAW